MIPESYASARPSSMSSPSAGVCCARVVCCFGPLCILVGGNGCIEGAKSRVLSKNSHQCDTEQWKLQ